MNSTLTSEYFESLDITISQSSDGHRYGAESIALASFCRVPQGARVAELGSGCGVISLLIAKRDRPALVAAVEIDEEAHRVAVQNALSNDLGNIVRCVNEDWRDFAKKNKTPFDIVVTNPPFYASNSGRLSNNPRRACARHEIHGSIGELLRAASLLLKPGGSFFIVFNLMRRDEFMRLAKSENFLIAKLDESIAGDYFLTGLERAARG